MDPICHTLVGGALAQSGLKHRTRYATAALLIGANLPDIDVLSAFWGTSLAFRRGLTHGVLAWVVLPLALTGVLLTWGKVRPRRPAEGPTMRPRALLALSTVALLTHPFLDWLNVYGIRLLAPFSGRWFYGDAVFIVDPWMWAMLAVGIVLVHRRERLERRDGHAGPAAWAGRPARIALGVVAGYIGFMIALTSFGRWVVRKELEIDTGLSKRAMMVAPGPINPLSRQVVLNQPDRYWWGRLHWLPRPRLDLSGDYVPKAFSLPAEHGVEADARARQLMIWARFPYYTIEFRDRTKTLRLDDMRYGMGRPSWAEVTWPLP